MVRVVIILLLMVPFLEFAPVGGKRPAEDDLYDGEKRAKILPKDTDLVVESTKCHFNEHRNTSYETKDRPEKSKVSTTCSGKLVKLSDLAEEPGILNARNLLELVEVRGEGRFDDFANKEVISQYEGKYICEGHLEELGYGWSQADKFNHYFRNKAKQPTCSHPKHVGRRSTIAKLLSPSSSVTLEESKATLKYEGFLLHVGTPVCSTHKKHVQELAANMSTEEKGNNIDHPPLDDLMDSSQDASSQQDEVQEPFNDIDPFIVSQFQLKHRTQQKKVCATRRLMDVIYKIAAKDDWKEFRCQVQSSKVMDVYNERKSHHKYAVVMDAVADRFIRSPTRRDKELVISTIALRVPLHELRKFIPGLAQRLFNRAKDIAKMGMIPEIVKHIRTRFNPIKLSPEVFADLPFGFQTVTASDGTKFNIPNSLRLHRASEIVHMYNKHMKAKNLEHYLFSNSTLFEILSICSATQRKASVCVDYFYSESELAFDDLSRATEFIVKNQIQTKGWKEVVDVKLKESRFYLKGDFRLHTKNHSRVADHCWVHALSDPDSPQFSQSCSSPKFPNSHKHDLKCGRCEMLREVLGDIRDALVDHQKDLNAKKSKTAADVALLAELTDQVARVQEAEERIIDYKKHQLRGSFTYKVREQIIEKLKEGEALVTLDFGQKFLPMKFKEKQSDYFGKKGMTFHVAHVATTFNFQMAQHNMVHIITNDRQDSVAITQIIQHLFEELIKVKITVVHLRSDNAGAYHSGSTISSIHSIAEATGMTVASYCFSESQTGKSNCDRVAGTVKNKVRGVVNSGKDAHNHKTFFETAVSGRLIDATSFYLVSVENTTVSKNKIVKITDLNDFSFEKDGIRAWRHKGVGEGTFIKSSSFKDKGNTGELKIERKGGYYPAVDGTTPAGFWRISRTTDAPTCQGGAVDDTPSASSYDQDKIFHCPEPTCSSSFSTKDDLEVHILRNDHCSAPLKYTLRDLTLNMFSERLEGVVSERLVIPEVDEAVDEVLTPDQNDAPPVDQGYALKKKKPSSRYAEKAKVFVEMLFDEGITTGTKVPPDEAEERMREALNADGTRMFTPEERLCARQIDSYYSRIKAERRAASVNGGKEKGRKKAKRPKRDTEDEEEEEEEGWEDFDADEDVFDDEEFMNDGDLLMAAVTDNMDKIFDMSQEMEIMEEELEPSTTTVEIKPENEIFGIPTQEAKQIGAYGAPAEIQHSGTAPIEANGKTEICGAFGVPADDQEKCRRDRALAIASGQNQAIEANGKTEICGAFGVPADDQEKCRRDRALAIASGQNQAIEANGDLSETQQSGSGTAAITSGDKN